MRSRALLAVALLLAPLAAAQLPPSPLDPVLDSGRDQLDSGRERALGPELTREDVDVKLDMTFDSVDFDTVNVIFGGGTFRANARVDATIDMRVIATSRVQQAIDGAQPAVGNVTAIALAGAEFIPADAFRATFAAEALRAFQDDQEARLAEYITRTIPNVTVLYTGFAWANTTPQSSFEDTSPGTNDPPQSAEDVNDPTYPPLTLRAVVQIQYIESTSLFKILDKALQPQSDAEKDRKREVADAAAGYERSAFGLLGIRQVLDLQAFEGWDLAVRVRLPEGFTFEEASPDVRVTDDLREAEVLTLGADATGTVLNPVSLTLSNRFLVSAALLGAVLLCGAILRFPILLGVNLWRRKMRG